MLYPTCERFYELAESHNRVVLYREIAGDLLTPIGLLQHFSDETNLFLLESANLDKSFSRYTIFGFRPRRVITYRAGCLSVESREEGIHRIDENPIDYIMKEIRKENSSKEEGMGDFCGGYVGFLGYDMVNFMGTLRTPVREDRENLLMGLFQVDEYYVFDNHMGKLHAACSVPINGNREEAYRSASERTLTMAVEILSIHQKFFRPDDAIEQLQDFDQESFMNAATSLKQEITDGECIQVVLSNRYETRCTANPINLYRLMRNINPSPYMFYLKFGDDILCGTSPEIHLKISDRRAVLKPIAGTYKVEKDRIEEIKRKLLQDEKEKAEHLMLLDLARNDLYTGCESASVKVVSSFQPEVYSHVIHIVSEVAGHLRDGVEPFRLFCNTFPAGTVSGAPKVRAMELINQYEKSPRGFYAGCAGYFSYSQDIDTCIIIRSALLKRDSVTLRAGAGIVYDSDPAREYAETHNKLGALFQAIRNIATLENKNVFND